MLQNITLFKEKYARIIIALRKYFIEEKNKFIQILKSIKINMYNELFDIKNNQSLKDYQFEEI